MYLERHWHQCEFETIEKLRGLAEQAGESLAKSSLAWVLANPPITSAIIGASHTDQLTGSLAATDLVLDTELTAQLDNTTAGSRWGDAAR